MSDVVKERDISFDIVKGICILLMIIGHSAASSQVTNFIYSFHMPVFLFISGYFLSQKKITEILQKNFRTIVVPCVFVYLVCFGAKYGIQTLGINHRLFSNPRIQNWESIAHAYLPIWFLWTLFESRLLFHFLLKIKNEMLLLLLCFIFALFFTNIAQYSNIPFAIGQTMRSMIFIYVGILVKRHDLLNVKWIWKHVPFLLCAWLLCFSHDGILDLYNGIFQGFIILDVLGALGVFIILYLAVSKLDSATIVCHFLHFCGRFSLVILCLHSLEVNFLWCNYTYVLKKMFSDFYPYALYVFLMIRIFLIVIFSYFTTKSKFLMKYIFGQKV